MEQVGIITGIYQIQSKIKPERIYIGSAINIYARWRNHRILLEKKCHHNRKLQNHYNKYGVNDLQYSILLGCEKDNLINAEQYFIDSHNPYFNLCKIAGSLLGTRRTDEQKEKMAKKKRGTKQTEEHIRKRVEARKGKHWSLSEETKKKIGLGSKNRIHKSGYHFKLSEEARRDISKRNKGRKRTQESIQRMKDSWVIRKQNKQVA